MAVKRKNSATENKAVAFMNWSVVKKDGSEVRSKRGFPIYESNDQYPNPLLDSLVKLAMENNGKLELNLKAVINMVNHNDGNIELSLEDL